MNNLNFFMIMNMFCLLSFMLFYFFKHLLLIMISLEFIMSIISYLMFNYLFMNDMSLIFMIFLFVMMVCDGVLGLSLIVLTIRLYGNDYLNSLSLLKW